MAVTFVQATQFIDPSGSIVKSATAVGAAVLEQLDKGSDVVISLAGMKGVSSSYFNLVLQAIVERHGAAVLNSRVRFAFNSPAQDVVYQKSLRAVQSLPRSSASG